MMPPEQSGLTILGTYASCVCVPRTCGRTPERARWSHAMIVSRAMVVPATNTYVLGTVCVLRTYLRDGRQEACGGRPGDHRVQPWDVRVPRARPEDVRDGRRPSASASLMRTMCWWGTLTPMTMMFALLCAHDMREVWQSTVEYGKYPNLARCKFEVSEICNKQDEMSSS